MWNWIQQALTLEPRREEPLDGWIEAAVLVPLFEKEGKLCFLMERRPNHVSAHAGQIAYPGGVRDAQDADSVACALREAQEEVGLDPGLVSVLGLLSDTVTVTGYRVTPVVGRIPWPVRLTPSPDEVDGLLEVPWDVIAHNPAAHQEMVKFGEREVSVNFFPFGEHCIWGATARMAKELIDRVAKVQAMRSAQS